MPAVCCIPRCTKRSWPNNASVSYHLFPKDPKLLKKWTNFVRYADRNFNPKWSSKICAKHFSESSFQDSPYSFSSFVEHTSVRLKQDAVPTILYAHKADEVGQPNQADDNDYEDDEIGVWDDDNDGDDTMGHEQDRGEYQNDLASETKLSTALRHRRNVLNFVKLTDINAYITCFLCGGYMYNATTITECLHSFCRKCILQHFQKDNRCPTCDILIHESIPFNFIRQDGHLQTIINKLLPNFERMEKEGERKSAVDLEKQVELPPDTAPLNPSSEVVPIYSKTVSSAQINLQLEYLGASSECPPILPLEKNFIRVSSQATIKHVQKFIAHKLKLGDQIEVDIICGEEILQPAVILYNLKREVNKEQIIDNILVLSYSLGMSQ